jgi:hypothetical protein
MCCYRRVLLDIHFPLCIFKKLLHRTLGIEELSEVHPYLLLPSSYTFSVCLRAFEGLAQPRAWLARKRLSRVGYLAGVARARLGRPIGARF